VAPQGGGSIGAFHTGGLETVHEANVTLDACYGGSSIGAINGAIFFGDTPSRRVERLSAGLPGFFTRRLAGRGRPARARSPVAIDAHWAAGREAATTALELVQREDHEARLLTPMRLALAHG
jgi:predicted acylesterase/phospholipase RssA